MTGAEDYVGRCRAAVIEWSERLPSEAAGWAMHLIDHDEPAEGMCSLAWAIHEVGLVLDHGEIVKILDLIGDLVPADSLPPSFRGTGTA